MSLSSWKLQLFKNLISTNQFQIEWVNTVRLLINNIKIKNSRGGSAGRSFLRSFLIVDLKLRCILRKFTQLQAPHFWPFLGPGAIIRDGDRKSWDPRGPMIWDNFSIFRTNCAILTSYIRADPRTCLGLSRGCCHVAWWNGESCEILLPIFHSEGKK